MRVVWHSDAFVSPSPYGLSRYAHELYEALAPVPGLELVPFSSRVAADAAHVRELESRYGYRHPAVPHRPLVLAWTLAGWPPVEYWVPDADLVHTVEMSYPVATRRPWIVTVHDLGPLSHPAFFSRSRPSLVRRGLARLARRADAVVAVSRATAEAVEHFAPQPLGERLVVIAEGVSPAFFAPPPADALAGLEDLPPAGTPYFLWTGSVNPRKNLARVVQAFEQVAPECEHHLVLAGGLAWDGQGVLAAIARSPFAERIHRPGFVTDDQLRALYRGAAAFVYVSLMEGFGLPILEAMASGCPVITSNLSSMPEVAGDAALLADPKDAAAIEAAMRRIAGDRALAARLGAAGRERAAGFTWQAAGAATAELYRAVARA